MINYQIRLLAIISMVLAILAMHSTSVAAKSFSKVVPTNKTSWIISRYSWRGLCEMHKGSKGFVSKQTKHGRLTVKMRVTTIGKGRRCAGSKARMMDVYYKPNRGYRGKDKGSVKLSFPASRPGGKEAFFYDINITVK